MYRKAVVPTLLLFALGSCACSTTDQRTAARPIELPADEAPSADAPPETGSVSFVFAWKPGASAQVRDERTVRFQLASGNVRESQDMTTRTVRVEAIPEGLLVANDDVQLRGEKVHPAFRLLAESAEDFQLVIGADGSLRDFRNLSSLHEKLDVRIDADTHHNSLPAEERTQRRAMLHQALAAEPLDRTAAGEWNNTVGAWAGRTLVLGQREELGPWTWTATGWVPCPGEAEGIRCVRLSAVSRSNQQQEAATRAFLERSSAAAGEPAQFDAFEVEDTMELIVDPSTLRPMRLQVRHAARTSIKRGSGLSKPVTMDMVRTVTWAWN